MITSNMYFFYDPNSSDYLKKVKTVADLKGVINLFDDTTILFTLDYDFMITMLNTQLGSKGSITLYNTQIQQPTNVVITIVIDGKEDYILLNGVIYQWYTTMIYPTNRITVQVDNYIIDLTTALERNKTIFYFAPKVAPSSLDEGFKQLLGYITAYQAIALDAFVTKDSEKKYTKTNLKDVMETQGLSNFNLSAQHSVEFRPKSAIEKSARYVPSGLMVTLDNAPKFITSERTVAMDTLLGGIWQSEDNFHYNQVTSILPRCDIVVDSEVGLPRRFAINNSNYTQSIDHNAPIPQTTNLKMYGNGVVKQFTIINQVENYTDVTNISNTNPANSSASDVSQYFGSALNTVDIEILPTTSLDGEFPFEIGNTFYITSKVKKDKYNKPLTIKCTIVNFTITYSTTSGFNWIINSTADI